MSVKRSKFGVIAKASRIDQWLTVSCTQLASAFLQGNSELTEATSQPPVQILATSWTTGIDKPSRLMLQRGETCLDASHTWTVVSTFKASSGGLWLPHWVASQPSRYSNVGPFKVSWESECSRYFVPQVSQSEDVVRSANTFIGSFVNLCSLPSPENWNF